MEWKNGWAVLCRQPPLFLPAPPSPAPSSPPWLLLQKWVTAGRFCRIDIRYQTIHQAADSSPMLAPEEEPIPICTTHMHTHTQPQTPTVKISHQPFWVPLPSIKLAGLGLREGECWLESCEANCKSTGMAGADTAAYSLLMVLCHWVKWELYCVLHLWWLKRKFQCFPLSSEGLAQMTAELPGVGTLWPSKLVRNLSTTLAAKFYYVHFSHSCQPF